MSTRKNFIAIAALVAAIKPSAKRKEIANQHAAIFAAENPRFDRARFLSACGLK